MAVVASWLTLTFSLTEQIKDYSGQARALHECGQKVNDLRKRLQATPISASQQLIPFVQAYEAIIRECGPNHQPLDYEIGRLSGARALDGLTQKAHTARLRRLRLQRNIATTGVYVLMWIAPAIAGDPGLAGSARTARGRSLTTSVSATETSDTVNTVKLNLRIGREQTCLFVGAANNCLLIKSLRLFQPLACKVCGHNPACLELLYEFDLPPVGRRLADIDGYRHRLRRARNLRRQPASR